MKDKNIKRSNGIIIFDKKIENVLLVQKRCTYSYIEFILGKYDKNNKVEMIDKFNKMTIQEKMIISSLEFEWMWYNMFMVKDKDTFYCRSFGRFYKCFLNNPKLLRYILSQSYKNGDLIWEPPKGRLNKNESHIECAIREVYEETKIRSDMYKIISNKKVKKQINTNNTKYIMTYYTAIMKSPLKNNSILNIFDRQKNREICNILWIDIKKIR